MDVHLRDLRYFLAVAEELHFTRAAARLYISQSALSKQLRVLERQLGFALFERDRHGVVLTPEGAALVPTARELLDQWRAGWERARAAAQKQTLVIGLQTAIGRPSTGKALERFRTTHPDWAVEIRMVAWDDPTAGLLTGSSDVAVCWLPLPPDGLAWRTIFSERRWVAMPSAHRLAKLDEVPFEELADEPFLALPESAGPLRDFWLAVAEREGKPVRIGGVVSTADETLEAIATGLGVALLAEGNASLYGRPGVVCRPVIGLAPAELALVWRINDQRPVVQAFLDSF